MVYVENVLKREVSLNDNEIKVLTELSYGDDFDEIPMMGIPDLIGQVEGLTPNQVKGYLSDLVKKDVIYVLEAKEYSLGCNCVTFYLEPLNQLIKQNIVNL